MRIRYILISIGLFTFSKNTTAQNLVLNPGFEQYSSCPTNNSPVNGYCDFWSSYTTATPDYFNSCNTGTVVSVPINSQGNQLAATGNAYTGLYTYNSILDYKEYMHDSIAQLTPGYIYRVSLSASLGDYSGYGTNDLGVYFFHAAPGFVNTSSVLPVTPQISYSGFGAVTDKTGWTRLTNKFIADSAYDNIVIGGFLAYTSMTKVAAPSGNNSAYYYIDSVEVKRISNIQINFSDTVFCAGDTITVPYTLLYSNYFTSGNTLTLQLSGPTGSFTTPANIGAVLSITAGAIQGIIPATIIQGTGYRLRIVSSTIPDTSLPTTKNIQIKTLPIPTAGSNSSICEGNTLNLTATATVGSSYAWTGVGSYASPQQNPSISNTVTTQSGDYIVTATLNGCSAKDTVTVTVNSIPAVPTAGSNSPVCSGNDINLTSASTTNGVSYNWSGPGGYNSTTQNPTRFNSTTGMSGTYNVTATLNGCTSAAGTTSVTVNQSPATPAAGSNSPVCAGASLNLTANNTTGASYSWTGPNGFTSTQQNPVVNPATMADGGTYDVTATLNGCTSATGSTTIVINNVSSIAIYPSPSDSVCNNSPNVTFVAIPNNAGSSPQYHWFKNGAAITGATNLTYNATGIITNDTFQCRMTVTGLCSDPLILYSNKIGMAVLPDEAPPAISISASPGTLLSPWQTVTFTATPGGNMGASPSYQWKRNGQNVIGAVNSTWSAFTLSDNDDISCTITSSVLCAYPKTVESNKITIHIKTGIGDIDDEHIRIYPNPAQDELIIEGAVAGTDIMISDIVGHTLLHSTASEKIVHINTAQLVKGNYLLQLSSAEGKRIVKLVK